MPCPHCPHCQEEERAQKEAEQALLKPTTDAQNHSPPVVTLDSSEDEEVAGEEEVELEEEVPELRPEQKSIAEQICSSIMDQKMHFIDGIAGTGKSYLLEAIEILLKNKRMNVLVLSTSQHITKAGHTLYGAKLKSCAQLEHVDCILIDNVNTVPSSVFYELSDKCKRAMNSSGGVLFGGKGVVLAGDYGQCPPYSPCGDSGTLKHFTSDASKCKTHVLSTGTDEWSQWLSEIRTSPKISIPSKYLVNDMKTLIEKVFGDVYFDELEDGVILTPTKKKTEEVNNEVLKRMSGKTHVFEALFNDNTIRGDLDIHELRIKNDSILILEESYEGVSKNTRLRFEEPNESNTILACRVLDGPHKGKALDIKRVNRKIAAHLGESQQWVRQFPVSLAFAMTIYLSQGRRFDRVGCYRLDAAYEHGQVYTAISRATSGEHFYVMSQDEIIPNKIDRSLF